MATFTLEYTVTVKYTQGYVTVEAESLEEAIDIVEDKMEVNTLECGCSGIEHIVTVRRPTQARYHLIDTTGRERLATTGDVILSSDNPAELGAQSTFITMGCKERGERRSFAIIDGEPGGRETRGIYRCQSYWS